MFSYMMKINNFQGDLTDISAKKEALISKFNAQFPNPLTSLTASAWMQHQSILKTKQMFALNVGKRVRDKYVRYIRRQGPSKSRSQSSSRVHYISGI